VTDLLQYSPNSGTFFRPTTVVEQGYVSSHAERHNITSDVERFLKLESIGITPKVDETTGANEMKTYMDTCVSFKDSQYSEKLPWKRDHPPLPSYYDVSARRTHIVVKNLRRDPFLFRKYDDIINKQLEKTR